MKTIEESVVTAMDGTDTDIFPFLPYILQDFWEIGTSAEEVATLLKKQNINKTQVEVLDLGCGKGAVSIELAEKFRYQTLGIDAIKEFIDEANRMAKEYAVDNLCEFRVADIREEIKMLGKYDIIVLGAIGQVYGNYYQTLSTLLPHLKDEGIIIIDDAYIVDSEDTTHPSVLQKEEMLKQIDRAGMILIDEIIADKETFDDNEEDFELLVKSCNELMIKHPDKASLFQNYIDNQRKEYDSFEADIVCSSMLLKRK